MEFKSSKQHHRLICSDEFVCQKVLKGIASFQIHQAQNWQVYMGVWKDQEVAVKLARQKPISLKQERHFQQQAAKLFHLDHPNIVRFLGACCWKVTSPLSQKVFHG